MPDAVSNDGSLCLGIQFGDVDWKGLSGGAVDSSTFGEQEVAGEGPSSTPEVRQDLGEGLLVVDQGQLQGEGAGRAGGPLGVSGTLALAQAPACSTAPSPLPSLTHPGLLGGGGADDKKVLSFKPSTQSRAGLLLNLAQARKTSKEIESVDTASMTSSEAPSSHPAYLASTSLEIADGNFY